MTRIQGHLAYLGSAKATQRHGAFLFHKDFLISELLGCWCGRFRSFATTEALPVEILKKKYIICL